MLAEFGDDGASGEECVQADAVSDARPAAPDAPRTAAAHSVIHYASDLVDPACHSLILRVTLIFLRTSANRTYHVIMPALLVAKYLLKAMAVRMTITVL